MKERFDYLLTAFDFYLNENFEPKEAWEKALIDYAFVYHTDDGRLPISRASEIVLQLEVNSERKEDRP